MVVDPSKEASDLYQRGRTALERGALEDAAAHLERSLKIAPHYKTAELLGECLLRQNKAAEAAVYLAAAAGLGTNAFRAKYLLGCAMREIGDTVDAYRHAKDAVEMNPNYRRARELIEELSTDAQVVAMLAREES